MTFNEFDQTEDQGWRLLARQRDFTGAARAIETYLKTTPDLEPWQSRILHFHAVQMHAFGGAIERALPHLPFSRDLDEAPDAQIRWNDYVTATEAFLRGDRVGLISARERIALGQEEDGPGASNLRIVDRLIAGFGNPYSKTY